jgi:hypothetical protein
MTRFVFVAIAALAVASSALAGPKEPACCKGKKCNHVIGESKKHHKCNKKCHDKHQKKGACCRGHKH